jgi:hypothetical protein
MIHTRRSTRRLLALCAIAAANLRRFDEAAIIFTALQSQIDDTETLAGLKKILDVLVDKRRLTEPSYSPWENFVDDDLTLADNSKRIMTN